VLPILSKIHEPGTYYPTIKDIRKWHAILNELIFDGKIPKFYDIEIKRFQGQYAACVPHIKMKPPYDRCVKLQIDPKFRNFKLFLAILVHEMIHCHEWINYGKMTHGKKSFFMWKEKLAEHNIPLRERYHKKFLDIPM
jgi:hypothetical protein